MSLDRVLQLIKHLGFSDAEAEVYVHLAKMGPKGSKELADSLNLNKRQLPFVLKTLQERGAVTTSQEGTILFSALPFEKLLNSFVNENVSQAKLIQKSKKDLLENWQQMVKENST